MVMMTTRHYARSRGGILKWTIANIINMDVWACAFLCVLADTRTLGVDLMGRVQPEFGKIWFYFLEPGLFWWHVQIWKNMALLFTDRIVFMTRGIFLKNIALIFSLYSFEAQTDFFACYIWFAVQWGIFKCRSYSAVKYFQQTGSPWVNTKLQ